MNDQPTEQDMLARLAEAFAGQAVPAGPSEAVKERLIAALEQRSKRSAAVRPVKTGLFRTWRGSTMQKVMSIAAVLAVVVIGALVATHSGSSGSAFAAMIDRINQIRTVRFEMQTDMKNAGEGTNLHAIMTLAKPWIQVETTVHGIKAVGITNTDEGKTLMLFENSKSAQLSNSKNSKLNQNDVVAILHNLEKQGAESLGKESVGGIEALKYRQKSKGDFHTVWIDPATNLPVQMTISDTVDRSAAEIFVTFSNFQWDVPVDLSKLTLQPPGGYQLLPSDEK